MGPEAAEALRVDPQERIAWTVSVQIAPASEALEFNDWARRAAAEALTGRSPVVSLHDGCLIVGFGVAGATFDEAEAEARDCTLAVMSVIGVGAENLVERVIRSNRAIDREFELLPQCAGVGEAAEILGVSKQRVGQLAARADFPSPVFRLRATPVWRDVDLRRFAEQRRARAAGRARPSSPDRGSSEDEPR